MNCQKCGNQLSSDTKFCNKCGQQVDSNDIYVSSNADVGSAGYYVLGAFVPILAIILGLVWKKQNQYLVNK